MGECIDIFRSIGATCNALNNVGGVNKRVWITQLSQLQSYTFDADGYLQTITLNVDSRLQTITGKKFSNSGNFEGVIGNARLIKQNTILKIFYSNPTDKSSLETYIKAQQLIVFFETESKKIEVYGLEKGMTLSALAGGTGTNLQDESSALYTISGEQKSLPFYFRNGTFIESIEYLNNLAIPFSITSYSALISQITFTNNGGDDWNANFFIAPTITQLPSGVTIVDYDYKVTFWVGGVGSNLEDGVKTVDYTYNAVGNGAGVYELKCNYSLSNGEHIFIQGIVKVDDIGNILQSIFLNGFTVNSVSGLVINNTLENTQFGYNGDRLFYTYDINGVTSTTNNGTNDTANITINLGDVAVVGSIAIDSSWSDYAGDFATISILIIS